MGRRVTEDRARVWAAHRATAPQPDIHQRQLRYECLKIFFIIYFLRERDSMSRGGAEREGDAEPEAGSRLRAVSTEPDAGLELTNSEIVT